MRRYDLDWLRVLVFALLIFYHVGMFFVPWGFHIKNNHLYSELAYPMWFLNQWRLPVLFIISGMGTYYALQKRTTTQFAWERITRLLIPLVFGMLFIIPPQVFIERIAKQQFDGTYLNFWLNEAFTGAYPDGNISWHHLWFLPYLLLFSLVLIPLFSYLKNNPDNKLISTLRKLVANPLTIYTLAVPLFITEYLLKPYFPMNHALVGDYYTIAHYIIIFLYGFLFITVQEQFWDTIRRYIIYNMIIGVVCFSTLVLIPENTSSAIESFVLVMNALSWILALLGFSARYLNVNSPLLKYCNQAVYPFYILHQTVMLILAYVVMDKNWGLISKASLMMIGTFTITWIIYELIIRRIRFLQPLFGVKRKISKK
ncbi:acyltransferase family protein [Fulvivirga sediminis]|uniref:Acyltransferase family protein n=1 Tax=Fulvivirga sediminis TaxID=2803949 RepID=A0A937FEF9_9BACT|nr:acyltransferase family protein [Fulvivirga sediminis]MBL3659023.1 acyltransferase family protein [Fulvivirga sediminis]